MTIKTTMLSLQALLCSPEPSDPQDAQVVRMYLDDRAEFIRMAKYWVQTHATPRGEASKKEAIDQEPEAVAAAAGVNRSLSSSTLSSSQGKRTEGGGGSRQQKPCLQEAL